MDADRATTTTARPSAPQGGDEGTEDVVAAADHHTVVALGGERGVDVAEEGQVGPVEAVAHPLAGAGPCRASGARERGPACEHDVVAGRDTHRGAVGGEGGRHGVFAGLGAAGEVLDVEQVERAPMRAVGGAGAVGHRCLSGSDTTTPCRHP